MRCVTVYTKNYEVFSDLFEELQDTELGENEEKEIQGITVSDAGEVPDDYIESMRQKPEVAVMKVRKKNIIILQHGEVFEVLFQDESDLAPAAEAEIAH
ncbi:NAD/NADP transhydrogenase alpha subunit [Tumebacillus sp. DT12]|uniref:NAD/NADP transhydrogenase alpha subunit n=1 Tax=Tumebacillus lacus TaxID=2995335 RepID=A0ABT3WYG8_9BACL|nr:NAD/NADP transhydrogenase alpha subunit [Tumebacillus lacus]MCX7569700.1 NAD/NADP transhydrogenase alpha subunit [Tumebacillus lacus]